MIVLWGPDHVQVYNDAYRVLMGAKHPAGLGMGNRECWPEVWHINRDIYPRVLAGETVAFKEAKYPLAPHGRLEDFFLTLSYSPVYGESGAPAGIIVTVFDVTREVRVREERDRALAESRAERERLYDVFMQAPAAIAVLEGDRYVFTVANPRYRELVGNRDVVGRPVAEALPEIIDQGFMELLDRVRTTGEAFIAHEAPVKLDRHGDGRLEEVYVDFVYQPLQAPGGDVFGIMAHAIETTEQVLARRRIEALAAERQEILGQIVDAVLTLDAGGHVTFLNAAARGIYPDLRVGAALHDAHDGALKLNGEPFGAGAFPLLRALRGDRVLNEEWLVEQASGRRLRIHGSAVPISDHDGTLVGAALTLRDVTEQRRLEQQAETERRRLMDVFLQAPAAIAVMHGPEHTITSANPLFRQLVGAGRPLDGLAVREALPEFEGQGFFDLLDRVYATNTPFLGREMLARFDRHGSGTPQDAYFNFVYQPLTDGMGSVTGIMIHAVEVTDQVLARKDVERQADELTRLAFALEQSNRDLDQFAYVASHDLKAPLRGLANLSQWIEEDIGDHLTDESRTHLALMKGRVHRMEALIDGILTYSRATRARGRVEEVHTGDLVAEVIELLAPPNGVTIEVAPDFPTVLSERIPLQQVFMNLISNAVKHSRVHRPDVRVRVGWTDAREGFTFRVADNGPGIAPEYHDRVWGIFQTLQARDKVEGTGIGLSVVKKIVESRGGHVWIDSAEGAGATFCFTWPRHVAGGRDSEAHR